MIVSIVGDSCFVYRQPADPVFRPNRSRSSWSPPGWYAAESRLLYNIQKALNLRGYNLLKKSMQQDGHMFGSEFTQYLRSRNLNDVPSFYLYHANYALEIAAESFNVLGRAEFAVVYGAGREDNPEFERTCRDRVARKESSLACYEVSWNSEATIDGHVAVHRLYRAFMDLDQASAFLKSEPGDSCRSIDRRSGEPLLLHGAC